jgi:uncharacterized protein YggE
MPDMTPSPTVSVRGEAVLEVQPELALLTISVEAHGSDRRAALDLLSQRARAVAELVTRFEVGIERSETSRLNVYPELDNKRTERVRRYAGRCSTSLSIHDFGVLSDLLVAASTIDLVSIDGPWWRLRTTSDVYRRARLVAASDAMARARDYAAAFGAEIVGLVEIADLGLSHQPMAHPGFGSAAAGAVQFSARDGTAGPEFSLEPGRLEVVGQVEARFTLTEPDLAAFPSC